MTVLVTGASGFLGSHVAEQLSLAGRPARALVRRTSNTKFLATLRGVELAYGSVEDIDSVRAALSGVSEIVHVAGLVKARSSREFFAVNAGGTENVVRAAIDQGVRKMVLVSSQAVGGPSQKGGPPVTVGTETAPVTDYGRSKLAAEWAVLDAKDRISSVILRPPAIYGPRDGEVLIFFKAVQSGVLPLTNPLDAMYSMIYGPDCASACIKALDANVASGSKYFIEDGEPISFAEMIRLVERAVGRKAWMRVPLPKTLVRAAAQVVETYGKVLNTPVMLTVDKCNELHAASWVCDGSMARRELGFEPQVRFRDGVITTAAWYRENGWL
jgi:nucleoside-diphosphate-sugar epimerase